MHTYKIFTVDCDDGSSFDTGLTAEAPSPVFELYYDERRCKNNRDIVNALFKAYKFDQYPHCYIVDTQSTIDEIKLTYNYPHGGVKVTWILVRGV